jgi:hypothetical protein
VERLERRPRRGLRPHRRGGGGAVVAVRRLVRRSSGGAVPGRLRGDRCRRRSGPEARSLAPVRATPSIGDRPRCREGRSSAPGPARSASG